jgi:hypothetical protein
MSGEEISRVCEERFARDKERLDRVEQREERISENLTAAAVSGAVAWLVTLAV